MRIGLLGGSFNPLHAGHIAISEEAIRKFNLSQVWLLVSPGNPLKNNDDLPSCSERVRVAEGAIKNPRIKVKNLETEIGTVYTIDTIKWLKSRYKHDFIWLMGADNLAIFHKWYKWREIAHLLPIVVFDRHPYTKAALCSKAAKIYPCKRKLEINNLPNIVYHRIKPHSESSTFIRRSA